MNKYKMVSICSLTIACVLMLSILLPIKTIANDKESIELNMHYENSQVTANIVVNSDVYTGVICKYIMIDDVLKSDNLLAETRDNGTTINLDKSENDTYTTTISNVNKRYVVIYVSIGNCSLCDYIDCQPGNSQNNDNSNKGTDASNDEGHKMSVEGEGTNGQKVEVSTDNKQEKTEQQTENKNEESKNQQEETKSEEKLDQQTENKSETNSKQKGEDEKIVVDNKTETSSNDFQNIDEKSDNKTTNSGSTESNKPDSGSKTNTSSSQASQSGNSTNTSSSQASQSGNSTNTSSNQTSQSGSSKQQAIDLNNYDKDSIGESVKNNNSSISSVKTGNKDSIDTSGFQEIEKTVTSSTADESMPQTGEDDFAKILGIAVFSAISVISFYKYKTTK